MYMGYNDVIQCYNNCIQLVGTNIMSLFRFQKYENLITYFVRWNTFYCYVFLLIGLIKPLIIVLNIPNKCFEIYIVNND